MTSVQLHFFDNKGMEFSDSQKNFLTSISEKLQKQLNTDAFRNQVLTFKYKRGRRTYQGFRLNKGKTRSEILEIIMSGKDPYDTDNNIINIHLKPYTTKPKIHATTSNGIRTISLNTRYVDYCIANDKTPEMARTLIHEYIHIIGFRHYTNRGIKKDKPTVPWGIGKIIEKLVKEHN